MKDGVWVYCSRCHKEWREHDGADHELSPLRAEYLTDERDEERPDRRVKLAIFHGGNGDWYVTVCPEEEKGLASVRLCTSGGASSHVPGLTVGIARAFRAIVEAHTGMRLG